MNELKNTSESEDEEANDVDISSDEEFEFHREKSSESLSSCDNDDNERKNIADSIVLRKRIPECARTSQTFSKSNSILNTSKYRRSEPRYTETVHASKSSSYVNPYYVLSIIVTVFCLFLLYFKQPTVDADRNTVDLNKLKSFFPQDEKFWLSINSGILEVKRFEKPSVIILMYKHSMSVSELLNNITMYASCVLSEDCFTKPIVLKGDELNTNELISDYGILIDRYRPLLEERHVMVVKNLNEIVGSVAQAFHYFCDEYTPLVKKSLILFTIAVNEYEGKPLQQAVNILERKWKDIDSDKLDALITRVSNMVLRLK